MKHLAIYPGSFDPLTNGHLDILHRSLNLFDKVIIAIAVNSNKNTLFSIEERLGFISEVTEGMKGLEIDTFQGLTVDYCAKVGATSIIRGLRAVTDFDYEYAISLMNKKLAPEVETVFLMSSSEYSFISSSIVKEVARHGRDVSNQVPGIVSKALLKKLSQ
ncbi:pantetheine-phosphate adenylyltransferase [Leptospira sp. WS92.C1]